MPSKEAVTAELAQRSECFCRRLNLTPKDDGWIKDPVNGTLSKTYRCQPSAKIPDDELMAAKVASFGAESITGISMETKELFLTLPVIHFQPQPSNRKFCGWFLFGVLVVLLVVGFVAVIKMRIK